jgi:hypothetical protein
MGLRQPHMEGSPHRCGGICWGGICFASVSTRLWLWRARRIYCLPEGRYITPPSVGSSRANQAWPFSLMNLLKVDLARPAVVRDGFDWSSIARTLGVSRHSWSDGILALRLAHWGIPTSARDRSDACVEGELTQSSPPHTRLHRQCIAAKDAVGTDHWHGIGSSCRNTCECTMYSMCQL